MKKFFILQIALITITLIVIKVMFYYMPNIGILRKCNVNDFKNMKARLILCDYATEPYTCTFEEYHNSMINFSNNYNLNMTVMVAKATGKYDSYNKTSVEYVIANNIIEGNKKLLGKELALNTQSMRFVYDSYDDYNERIDKFEINFLREVEYGTNKNILKEGHTYLVFIFEQSIPGITKPYYQFYDAFDFADTTSVACTTGESYICNYWDNEFFSAYQEEIEGFYTLKKGVFEYYGVKSDTD